MDIKRLLVVVLAAILSLSSVSASPAKGRGKSSSGSHSQSTQTGSKRQQQLPHQQENPPTPTFLSRGQTFRVVTGDTLVLPCEVKDLGNYVVLWRRGSTAVLTADKLMVTRDSRVHLVDGFNLEITGVVPQDAGDYTCQISDAVPPRDQVHTVEVLVPPSIRPSPSNGQLTARKGGTITLECKASGNPVPSIRWSRKDSALSHNSVEGFSITLDKVDRHQAGVYQCTASNGVGDPVTVDMQLDVLYPPEIEVERSWVHSGEGYEAQLVCVVHGQPQPQVVWHLDNVQLDSSDGRRLEDSSDNKFTLTIKHVKQEDFGNYSCLAENNLGRAKKYMELSGKPSAAEYRSDQFSRYKDSFNLSWTVDSYAKLEEVRLLYRKIQMNETHQQPGQWHDIVLKPENGPTFKHTMSYNIRGLEAGAVYEALVHAKNRYGWNDVSDLFQFYTRGTEFDIDDLGLFARSNTSGASLVHVPSLKIISTIFATLFLWIRHMQHCK